ncbi:hypothetical protein [Gordonia sp. MP11Mi]|uniref:Uncharacterized protein n=1 Tax=Gordonia sp. MP11Mi TaxID=3022769 RepID=A0AA97CUA3_9ACTN
MISPNRITDELVYATRRLLGVVEWHAETASDHGHADDCCSASLDAISSITPDMPRLLAQFTHFSDGRPMVTYVDVDGGGMQLGELWPPDPADHPIEPYDSPAYALAPHKTHGDRGHVIVTWWPADCSASVRYVEPLRLVVA